MCISSISLISKTKTNVVLIVLDVSYVHSMKVLFSYWTLMNMQNITFD